MKRSILSMSSILLVTSILFAHVAMALPDAPPGKRWELIPEVSDEFNAGFDESKWVINSPQWAGRKPGLFKASQVSVQNGNLRITADILPPNERVNGWTHAGGLVRSAQSIGPDASGYFETRMKANKTFMSSTFWLINKRNEGSGCDVRTTELDITETVGFNSSGANWIENTMRRMNSNTHSRSVSCGEPVGAIGGNANLGELASANYHTYGAWWKSPTEIVFYLDGVEQFTVTPYAPFNLDMYLRMVVETYDWNPPPSNGGMNGSFADRTTYYDYVRSYRLVDDNGSSTGTLVPAKIQAEDYAGFFDTTAGNSGGQYRNDSVDIENTTDTGGGYNVGWIDGNEWLEYPIQVNHAGEYSADIRVASLPGNGMFTVEVDGMAVGGAMPVEATGGWQSWVTKTVSLGRLSAGAHTLRVQVLAGNFNINWLDVSLIPSNDILLSADFSDGTAGFNYADDRFRGTSQPSYAAGLHNSSGYLDLNLGGIDNNTVTNMSGGWKHSFSLSRASNVSITARYRINADMGYDSDEYSEVLVAVDGNLIGNAAANSVERISAGGDSGWKTLTQTVNLNAGTHTITLGGFNNKKTYHTERTVISFDNLEIKLN